MNPRLFTLFGAGALFGLGLAISGMTDPGRVIGFLDVAGAWDPSLMFVMAGAVVVFGLGVAVQRKRSGAGWFGAPLVTKMAGQVDRPVVVGALVFGVGWGLSGFCPGPAIANLGSLRAEALVFVPTMAFGMLIARFAFGADRN